jgi:hypothetical protein
MPSRKDNQRFVENLFDGAMLLDTAQEWIRDNMKPDQIFDDNQLEQWAEEKGFVSSKNLEAWAEENGYTK